MSYSRLLAVAVENRIHTGVLGMTTRTRAAIRIPIIIGTGTVDSIIFSDSGYWRNISAITNNANSFTIVSAALENGVSSVPVYKGASRTWVVTPGMHDSQTDPVYASSLGLSSFPVGQGLWLKMELSFATTNMDMLISNRENTQITGTQSLIFDPAATTVVNGVDVVGLFTTSGTAPSSQAFFYAPMVLGYFSSSSTPKVIFGSGDSILAGTGDTPNANIGGKGFFQKAVYNGGNNPLASINTGKGSSTGAGANTATNDVVFKWAAYCTIGVDENATNDFTSTGTAVTPAQMTTITQTASTKMKAYGVLKTIRTKILMITTSSDSWATDSGQTITGSWGSGGNIETFNNVVIPSLVPTYYDSIVNMDSPRSTGNVYKWKNNGSTPSFSTTDGIHPNAAYHITMGAELRAAIDSIAFPLNIYDYLAFSSNDAPKLRSFGAARVWDHVTSDTAAQVLTPGYIYNAYALGMRAGDYLMVTRTAPVIGVTLHNITAVAVGGAATISGAL